MCVFVEVSFFVFPIWLSYMSFLANGGGEACKFSCAFAFCLPLGSY